MGGIGWLRRASPFFGGRRRRRFPSSLVTDIWVVTVRAISRIFPGDREEYRAGTSVDDGSTNWRPLRIDGIRDILQGIALFNRNLVECFLDGELEGPGLDDISCAGKI